MHLNLRMIHKYLINIRNKKNINNDQKEHIIQNALNRKVNITQELIVNYSSYYSRKHQMNLNKKINHIPRKITNCLRILHQKNLC